MAAPITHVVLAAKVFDKYFQDKKRKDFFVGTLFPDIRYLKVIDRDKTHFGDLSIVDLQNDDSFLAGVKFHSIIDVVREKFIVDNNIYSLCPQSKYITQSLKLLEDQLFYSHVPNWSEYIDYLNEILPNQSYFEVAKNDVRKWYHVLQQYFQVPPTYQTAIGFARSIGLPEEVTQEINENIVAMKANKKIVEILENLYKNIDQLLK